MKIAHFHLFRLGGRSSSVISLIFLMSLKLIPANLSCAEIDLNHLGNSASVASEVRNTLPCGALPAIQLEKVTFYDMMIGIGIAFTIGGATGLGISLYQASKQSPPWTQ